jgi:hypothetical protein
MALHEQGVDVRALAARTRRAYEIGRAGMAFRRAVPVAVLVLLSLARARRPEFALPFGGTLLILVAVLIWRGGIAARAVGPGILAGLVPMTLPLLVGVSGHGCVECVGGARWPLCMAACIGGGVVAGVVVGLWAARLEDQRVRFLATAGLIVALTGGLGCAFAGGMGIAGMLAGFLSGSAPVFAYARLATR